MKFKQRFLAVIILFLVYVMYILLWRSKTSSEYPVVRVEAEDLGKDLERSLTKTNDKYTTSAINFSERFQKRQDVTTKAPTSGTDPWEIWSKMVTDYMVTSNASDSDSQIEAIVHRLSTAVVKKVDIGFRGTQLKALMLLEGEQKVVFKPKRYNKEVVIKGKIYDGFDRHFGEIAAFHLDRLLGFYRAPIVAGRVFNISKEVLPVTSERLKKTFYKKNGDICFYGICYYCKVEESACGDGDLMEGSLTIWLPPSYKLVTSRHPWQRTYSENRKARWETDALYCDLVKRTKPYNRGPRLNSIIDTAIFDFLIGNGDRHHYETFEHLGGNGHVLHLDNGKSFGNPFVDDMSILAPLSQCCRILHSTWTKLNEFINDKRKPLSGKLKDILRVDVIAPVLTDAHLTALDRRLTKIINEIEKCIKQHGQQLVVVGEQRSAALTNTRRTN